MYPLFPCISYRSTYIHLPLPILVAGIYPPKILLCSSRHYYRHLLRHYCLRCFLLLRLHQSLSFSLLPVYFHPTPLFFHQLLSQITCKQLLLLLFQPFQYITAMAKYTRQAFDFYQQSPSALDANPAFQEDDEMSVLDEKILDPTSPTLSDSRKPSSYDQASDAFSQRNHSLWSDFAPPFLGSNSRQSSQVMFNGPFSYDQQSPWSLARKSGSCTPAASYDQFPSDFDHASTASFSGNPVDSMNSLHQMRPMSYRHSLAYVPPQAVAMSPQSSQGWMPAPTELPDSSSSHRTKSPMLRNSSPLSFRRDGIRESIRDGIRKKNARFDIPAERTLSNIDHLISQSMNEEEVKELKQQKRLLRNRQAA